MITKEQMMISLNHDEITLIQMHREHRGQNYIVSVDENTGNIYLGGEDILESFRQFGTQEFVKIIDVDKTDEEYMKNKKNENEFDGQKAEDYLKAIVALDAGVAIEDVTSEWLDARIAEAEKRVYDARTEGSNRPRFSPN